MRSQNHRKRDGMMRYALARRVARAVYIVAEVVSVVFIAALALIVLVGALIWR